MFVTILVGIMCWLFFFNLTSNRILWLISLVNVIILSSVGIKQETSVAALSVTDNSQFIHILGIVCYYMWNTNVILYISVYIYVENHNFPLLQCKTVVLITFLQTKTPCFKIWQFSKRILNCPELEIKQMILFCTKIYALICT